MGKKNLITSIEAIEIAKKEYSISVSLPTLTKYVEKHDLGYQLSGKGTKWVINLDKWREFLNGKNKESE